MKEYIDGVDLRDMLLCAANALEANKNIINELNVFPVPDGDTGTNMCLTMGAAVPELLKSESATVGEIAERTASALLRGARGNSGVILSLLFRGFAKMMKGKETVDACGFARALEEGVDAAYKAVMKPAEGTMLTVSRMTAKAAVEFAEAGSDFDLMLVCALDTAKVSLAETVNQNPVLKKAGVIDAGGKGYVVMLDAMLASLQGRYVPVKAATADETKEKADFAGIGDEEITFTYCTEFIVERGDKKDPARLRNFLLMIGDSAVLVDDDEIIKVHVHTDMPGEVLTEALTYGSLLTVKIENMREQHTELLQGAGEESESEDERYIAPAEKKFGVVAVCSGNGISALFRELGADSVVTGGQTMNPSAEDILKEVDRTPAEVVYILPNNKNIILAANLCVPMSEKKAIVIPTSSVPQGVAVMLALDSALDSATEDELCEDILIEAAESVHTALITNAARDSNFDRQAIKEGEYLALLDGSLVGSFSNTGEMFERLRARFSEYSPHFISIYYGEDVDEADAGETLELFSGFFPDAEITLIDGGQPVYSYMISAE